MFSFGAASINALGGCNIRLVRIASEAIKVSPYDFSITEGHRTRTRQKELFDLGRTHIDGVVEIGKHNMEPSLAWDFVPYPDTIAGVSVWDEEGWWRFEVVAGVIMAVANKLLTPVRWGGDWDGDGSRRDQTLHDLPHIELRG